jgi:hypothetical protein
MRETVIEYGITRKDRSLIQNTSQRMISCKQYVNPPRHRHSFDWPGASSLWQVSEVPE